MRKLFLSAAALALLASPACAASLMTVAEAGSPPIAMAGFYPQVMPFPPLVTQQKDFTSGTVQSNVLNAQTTYVCVNVNARAAIKVETGLSSVATTDWPLGVDAPWCFGVPKNSGYKISVIANP